MKNFLKDQLKRAFGDRFYNLFIKGSTNIKHLIMKLIYTLRFTFWKDNVTEDSVLIDQPLILISQIQRSGGTLLIQLFDNHHDIYAYPSELIFTNPKWDWSKKKNYICYKAKILRDYAEQGFYVKSSVAKNELKNKFDFNLLKQRRIFENALKRSERDYSNAYFTSFFNSFENYSNLNGQKKYISAFTPRAIMFERTVSNFFSIYPNGFMITMVRNPISWLASASRHSSEYESDLDGSMKLWCKSTESSIQNAKDNPRVILVIFEELLKDTYDEMKNISARLGIDFNDNLLIPTFNGQSILSDSSFMASKGIDNSAADRIKSIDISKVDAGLIKDSEELYKKAIQACNLQKNQTKLDA